MMPPGHGGPSMFWMWARGRRNPETGPANSGLTGDPVIEEPAQPQGPKDLRSRWRNLKESVRGTTAALPEVIRLVWHASPRITAGLFAATVVAGVVPAMSPYTSKLLLNALGEGMLINQKHISQRDPHAPCPPHPRLPAPHAIVFLAILP